MSEFDKLAEEIAIIEQETLSKAMPADDDKIKAASAAGNADADDDGKDDVTGEELDDEDDYDDEEEEEMGKSFSATLPNGEEAEVLDVSGLFKSMLDDVGSLKGDSTVIAKALTSAAGAIRHQQTQIDELSTLVKSQQDQLVAFGAKPRKRKAVLQINERGAEPLAKSHAAADSPADLLAKCDAAHDMGKITGRELSEADAAVRSGESISPAILSKIGA